MPRVDLDDIESTVATARKLEDDDSRARTGATGFIFGNVDKTGHLEPEPDRYDPDVRRDLDEIGEDTGGGAMNSSRHLGVGERVGGDAAAPAQDFEQKVPEAKDFSSITELADDAILLANQDKFVGTALSNLSKTAKTVDDEENYDEDDAGRPSKTSAAKSKPGAQQKPAKKGHTADMLSRVVPASQNGKLVKFTELFAPQERPAPAPVRSRSPKGRRRQARNPHTVPDEGALFDAFVPELRTVSSTLSLSRKAMVNEAPSVPDPPSLLTRLEPDASAFRPMADSPAAESFQEFGRVPESKFHGVELSIWEADIIWDDGQPEEDDEQQTVSMDTKPTLSRGDLATRAALGELPEEVKPVRPVDTTIRRLDVTPATHAMWGAFLPEPEPPLPPAKVEIPELPSVGDDAPNASAPEAMDLDKPSAPDTAPPPDGPLEEGELDSSDFDFSSSSDIGAETAAELEEQARMEREEAEEAERKAKEEADVDLDDDAKPKRKRKRGGGRKKGGRKKKKDQEDSPPPAPKEEEKPKRRRRGLEWSLFPCLNSAVDDGDWLDSVVWDDQIDPKRPLPTQLILDMNDPGMLIAEDLSLPPRDRARRAAESDEEGGETAGDDERPRKKTRQDGPDATSGRVLFPGDVMLKLDKRQEELFHRWGASNDEFYATGAAIKQKIDTGAMHHSKAALTMHKAFFPLKLSEHALREFHRPRATKLANTNVTIQPCRDKKRVYRSGEDPSAYFKHKHDLSLSMRDSSNPYDLVLMEYMEETPMLMSNVGMASDIVNFYRKRSAQDPHTPAVTIGQTSVLTPEQDSPFLGEVERGELVPAIRNRLFLAPLGEHAALDTDFLVLHKRDTNKLFVRPIGRIFTVGQQQPLMAIPMPNQKSSRNTYIQNRIERTLYKLFKDNNRTISNSMVNSAFRAVGEEVRVKKTLKDWCGDMTVEMKWVLRPEMRIPLDIDWRDRGLEPEVVCLNESMEVGEQRALDLDGVYTDEEMQRQVQIDEKLAPWVLSQNFLNRGKGTLLRLTGPGDPISAPSHTNEGFSFVKLPTRKAPGPRAKGEKKEAGAGETATSPAKAVQNMPGLTGFAKPQPVAPVSIAPLVPGSTRAVVAVKPGVPPAPAPKRRAPGATPEKAKKATVAQQVALQREKAKKIFKAQLELIQSAEKPLFSDEEDAELDDFANDITAALEKNKPKAPTGPDVASEVEELKKLREFQAGKRAASPTGASKPKQQVIKITTTGANGEKRVEIIRDPLIVSLFTARKFPQRRKANDPGVSELASAKIKKETQMEKKRLEKEEESKREILARHEQALLDPNMAGKDQVCGACGMHGHMRTNRNCPKFVEPTGIKKKGRAAVKFGADGTAKINLSAIQKKAQKNTNRTQQSYHKDLLERPRTQQRPGLWKRRMRENPHVRLSGIFDLAIKTMRDEDKFRTFHYPVREAEAPNYHVVVQQPMDLSTMAKKAAENRYKHHDELLADVKLMADNSMKYNLRGHPITELAFKLVKICEEFMKGELGFEIQELEDEIARQEANKQDMPAVAAPPTTLRGTMYGGGTMLSPLSDRGSYGTAATPMAHGAPTPMAMSPPSSVPGSIFAIDGAMPPDAAIMSESACSSRACSPDPHGSPAGASAMLIGDDSQFPDPNDSSTQFDASMTYADPGAVQFDTSVQFSDAGAAAFDFTGQAYDLSGQLQPGVVVVDAAGTPAAAAPTIGFSDFDKVDFSSYL